MADSKIEEGRCDQPHHLDGIPTLAGFINSSSDLAIYRRFNRLGARNLLHLQNRLKELEQKLDDKDKQNAEEGRRTRTGAFDTDRRAFEFRNRAMVYETLRECADRHSSDPSNPTSDDAAPYSEVQLHLQIASTLHEYRQALNDEHQVLALPRPSTTAFNTFKRYCEAKPENILIGCDRKIVEDPEDLVALAPQLNDDRWNRVLEYTCSYFLRSRNQPNRQFHTSIYYYPPRRVQFLSYLLSSVFCGILLVGGMACLSVLNNRSWKLRVGIVAIFTFIFSIFIALLTNAKQSEVFAATAAYSAVLVVFVSSGLGPKIGNLEQ